MEDLKKKKQLPGFQWWSCFFPSGFSFSFSICSFLSYFDQGETQRWKLSISNTYKIYQLHCIVEHVPSITVPNVLPDY